MAKNGKSKNAKATPLQDPQPPKWDAAEMLGAKKVMVHSVTICLDSELSTAATLAQSEMMAAERAMTRKPDVEALADAYEVALEKHREALEAAAGQSVKFTARALPRVEYDALTREHPATIEQQAEWQKKLGVAPKGNPETFAPVLMAACMVDPVLTNDQAKEIWEQWSDAEAATVFDLCQRVQMIVL